MQRFGRRRFVKRAFSTAAASWWTLHNRDLARAGLAAPKAGRAVSDRVTLGNTGIIRVGYNQELDDIVHKSRHAKDWVANLEKSERERPRALKPYST